MKKIVIWTIIILITLLLPFVLQWVLMNETIFPFNIKIYFTRETWFSFLGSYLGAIGTIFLGIIALVQNKRYKDLADQSNETLMNLQKEIRDLTEKNTKLIEINSKIEYAKYHPILTNLNYFFWNCRNNEIYSDRDSSIDVFQISFEGCDVNASASMSIDEIYEECYTFTYLLKNDGEHSIRNFTCDKILIDGNQSEILNFFSSRCDISQGDVVACTFVTEESLSEYIAQNNIGTITFVYRMENVIGDHFEMKTILDIFNTEKSDGMPFDFCDKIIPPVKI